MTPDEINRFLAIEVMDWSEAPFDMFPSKGVWFCPPDRKMTIDNCKQLPDFYHSIADTMRVVEKIGGEWLLSKEDNLWIASWESGMMNLEVQGMDRHQSSLPAAISIAAVEWAKAKMVATPTPTEP